MVMEKILDENKSTPEANIVQSVCDENESSGDKEHFIHSIASQIQETGTNSTPPINVYPMLSKNHTYSKKRETSVNPKNPVNAPPKRLTRSTSVDK